MENPLERVGITPEMIEAIVVTERDRERMHSPFPLTGRYGQDTDPLRRITSEYEVTRRSFWVEVEYLISLGDELSNYTGQKRKVIPRPFTDSEKQALRRLYDDRENGLYSEETFRLFKLTDDTIHHDVVAMERVGAYKLSQVGFDPAMIEAAFHFARTSNDINSPVFCSMVNDYLQEIYIPLILRMGRLFLRKAREWGQDPFAGQTHGQYAVPTTLKKVMANFSDGLRQVLEDLLPDGKSYRLQAKFSGPVGNECGLYGAYPDHNWDPFIEKFLASLGFDWAKMADQDEFNIGNMRLFHAMIRVNDLLEKYASDFWDYCSRGVLIKTPKKTESGSSSMVAKINPWRTEGGWEIFSDASSDLDRARSLGKYRRQGDLRRSMRRRLIAYPFGEIMVGVERLIDDLSKYNPLPSQIQRELDEHPEMAAFYLQTVFRREGVADAYDRIKDLTMGRQISEADLHIAIDTLVMEGIIEEDVGREVKEGMKPEKNIGKAREWSEEALEKAESFLDMLEEAYS